MLLEALSSLAEVDCVFITPKPLSASSLGVLRARCSVKAILTTEEILQGQENRRIYSWLPLAIRPPRAEAFFNAAQYRWRAHAPGVERLGSLDGYDLIVARYLQAATTFDLLGKCPLVIDVDDYDPDRLRQRIQHAGFLKKLTLRRALRYSVAAHEDSLPRADAQWIANPEDRRHPGLNDAILLPNIPYFVGGTAPIPTPADPNSRIFLMVGTLSYSANSDGVDAFIRQAWPRVIARYPDAEFHIVGQGMSERQKARWSRVPGVKPIGFVQDLSKAYEGCLAAVAPIQAGGGTNIKVLEAAAYQRVCVLTRIAHRGFGDTFVREHWLPYAI